jgi:hypothetical protein
MEPRPTSECLSPRVLQRKGGGAIGEHGPLAIWLNHDDDARAPATTLQMGLHSGLAEGSFQVLRCRIVADGTDESSRATSRHRGNRHICGATAAPSSDLGCRIRAPSPRFTETNGDLVDEVTNADDERPLRSSWG